MFCGRLVEGWTTFGGQLLILRILELLFLRDGLAVRTFGWYLRIQLHATIFDVLQIRAF